MNEDFQIGDKVFWIYYGGIRNGTILAIKSRTGYHSKIYCLEYSEGYESIEGNDKIFKTYLLANQKQVEQVSLKEARLLSEAANIRRLHSIMWARMVEKTTK